MGVCYTPLYVCFVFAFLSTYGKDLLSTGMKTCAARGSCLLSETRAQIHALSLEPDYHNDDNVDASVYDAADIDDDTDDSEMLLPQCGVFQEVLFSAFVSLSCASCQKWDDNCALIIVR